ncbi:MAG: hypothetical protein JHD15_10790 [Phenylobacterium sp.]|uniref:hypothetical protein n=1 Tax=Phenylobacterium sp. TaxID=1871053 RepID=UPI001A1ECC78|nr:hypothetical protein [Phenylobacterium sp.]MBJ7410829.1 hypothetical protein [Phenylobacterium sp.]
MSSKDLIRVTSPALSLSTNDVVLLRHTWFGHIKPRHGNVMLGHVRQAMTDPCEIAESTSVPGDYLLLNHKADNPSGQTTLRVPLRLDVQAGTNIVTSAYYVDATTSHKVVWKRGDG